MLGGISLSENIDKRQMLIIFAADNSTVTDNALNHIHELTMDKQNTCVNYRWLEV